MNNERFIEIETKLAYQEELLGQLNAVVIQQQKQIDGLALTCKMLISRIADTGNTDSGTSNPLPDEKPPHY